MLESLASYSGLLSNHVETTGQHTHDRPSSPKRRKFTKLKMAVAFSGALVILPEATRRQTPSPTKATEMAA